MERRTQAHQARLIEHVNTFSAAYRNTLNGFQVKLLSAGSGLAHAANQAQDLIYGTVQRQAAMLAFIDDFKLLGVVFFAVIPVLLLLRKPKKGASVPVH